MPQVPTIAIVSAKGSLGYVIINVSDFVAGVHQVYDPNTPAPTPLADVPVIPAAPGPATEADAGASDSAPVTTVTADNDTVVLSTTELRVEPPKKRFSRK